MRAKTTIKGICWKNLKEKSPTKTKIKPSFTPKKPKLLNLWAWGSQEKIQSKHFPFPQIILKKLSNTWLMVSLMILLPILKSILLFLRLSKKSRTTRMNSNSSFKPFPSIHLSFINWSNKIQTKSRILSSWTMMLMMMRKIKPKISYKSTLLLNSSKQ